MRPANKLWWLVALALSTPSFAQQRPKQAPAPPAVQSQQGINVGGNVTNATLIVGTPADKLKEIVEAGNRGWVNLTIAQRKELTALQRELGVNEGALKVFFAVLGERNVPQEQLATKLGEIARRFIELQAGVARTPASTPELATLRDQAKQALSAGRFDEADAALAKVQDVLRRNISTDLANLSETAAQRGELAMTQLRYADAAVHFAEAVRTAADKESRIKHLWSEANAHYTQGSERGDNAALEMAIARQTELVNLQPRNQDSLAWAATQNYLGIALATLGERESGTARLEQAVKAFRAALLEYTREHVPLNWAMTQNNLGNALQTLGERESGTARLAQAVQAYQAALLEYTRERVPLDWALTQNNLGNALRALGARESGPARLEQAVKAFQAALLERTREHVPLDWAMTQNNLGNALWSIGERESGTARLEQAVQAYQAALLERTRERVPLYWAMTQNNLGIALSSLGKRESGTARLEQAVQAYQAALLERTRERVPFDWAMTQENVAIAELALAGRAVGPKRRALLVAALERARAAQEVYVQAGASYFVEGVERLIAAIEAERTH